MRNLYFAILLFLALLSSIPLTASGDSANAGSAQAGLHDRRMVLKAFDAQGRYVGPLVPIDPITLGVAVRANGVLIVAPVSRIKLNGQVSASQYEWAGTLPPAASPPTIDCRNLPVIDALEVPGVLRPSFSVRSGTVATAYIAGENDSTPTPPNGQCSGEGSPSPGWLAASSYPLTQNYPEPLSIHY